MDTYTGARASEGQTPVRKGTSLWMVGKWSLKGATWLELLLALVPSFLAILTIATIPICTKGNNPPIFALIVMLWKQLKTDINFITCIRRDMKMFTQKCSWYKIWVFFYRLCASNMCKIYSMCFWPLVCSGYTLDCCGAVMKWTVRLLPY